LTAINVDNILSQRANQVSAKRDFEKKELSTYCSAEKALHRKCLI